MSRILLWPLAIAVALSVGVANAAEDVAGPTCPPDFSCFPPQPRDGACQHPAIVLDAQSKSTRYEDSPLSRKYEKACIAQAGSSVVRRGNTLRLTFSNGRQKTYKDDAAGCDQGRESCKQYLLYDYFPASRLLLINVAYNESQQWFLVSQQDGKELQIVAPPGYSPDRKWLASVYWTDGGDDGNNGVDIVPASLDPNGTAFHYRPKDYELWEYVRWDGNDRLVLKVTWRPGTESELVTWPAEVVRVNGRWQLNKLPPTRPRP